MPDSSAGYVDHTYDSEIQNSSNSEEEEDEEKETESQHDDNTPIIMTNNKKKRTNSINGRVMFPKVPLKQSTLTFQVKAFILIIQT